jgi:transposase
MRFDLSDEEWSVLEPLMPKSRESARPYDRRIINAIFTCCGPGSRGRIARTLRTYTGAYNRFNRWSRRGVWKRIFDALAAKSRDSLYLIDSTIVKAHRAASGAKRGEKNQAIGISRGGRTTKIHAVVDGKGRPLNFTVTGGEVHDNQVVEEVLNTPRSPLVVTADKGLRQSNSASADQRRRGSADHPEPPQRDQTGLLSEAFLSAAAQDRKLLLSYQGLAAHRHPLRQTGSKFPCRSNPHRRTLLDQAVSPDPRSGKNLAITGVLGDEKDSIARRDDRPTNRIGRDRLRTARKHAHGGSAARRSPSSRWNITTSMRKSSGKAHAIMTSARTWRHYCNTFGMNRLSKSSILAAGLDATSRRSPNSVSGCEVWEQDFLKLDLPDNHFDGVFANAALFHVPSQDCRAYCWN